MGDGGHVLRSGTITISAVKPSTMEISESVKQYLEQLIADHTNLLSGKIAALELKLQEKDNKIDELGGA